DGGTVRFLGAAGALIKNFNTITVGPAASLIVDNTAGNNNDRLPDQTTINLFGGTLRLIGNSGGSTETVRVVAPQGNFTSTIESDTTSGANARLLLEGLTPSGNNATVNFVGGGTRLSESGPNQIDVLQAPSGNLVFTNNIVTNGVVLNPDNSVDFATLAGGPNGIAVVPLPAAGYVTSFAASNPTSNVKILSGTVTLDKSRTVNALQLGPA